jgi:hypothetical protein
MHALLVDAFINGELLQGKQTHPIECDPMRAPGLGRREHRTRWSFRERTLNGEASAFKVDVSPPQLQELTSTRSSRRAEQKEKVEGRLTSLDGPEKPGDLRCTWRSDLRRH